MKKLSIQATIIQLDFYKFHTYSGNEMKLFDGKYVCKVNTFRSRIITTNNSLKFIS